MNNMISLSNRTVLITGVSSGLGAAAMRVFAESGASVVGCARRPEQGAALARELCDAGHDATFLAADITHDAQRRRLVEVCLERTQRLDVLINNAGALGEISRVEDVKLSDWEYVLAANLTSAFALCQLALPHMRRQRDGVILNVSSINAVIGITHMAAYSSSKAGLTHLTRVIASEAYADNIRANAIILGGVRSEMSDNLTTTLLERAGSKATSELVAEAQGRRLAPEDVAKALAVLCLPESRVITGSEIAIDQAVTAGRALSGLLHGAGATT